MDLTSLNNGPLPSVSIDLVQCPPISKTKGRPKQKRLKSGKELMRQVKHCTYCKCASHNITRCSQKENSDDDITTRQATKKKKLALENEDLNLVFCLKC